MSNELTLYSRAMCSGASTLQGFCNPTATNLLNRRCRNRAAGDEENSDSWQPRWWREEVLVNFDVEQLEKF